MSSAITCDTILRNGHVIDPSQHLHGVLDIGICDHRIVSLGHIDARPGAKQIDLCGKYVCPGLVDLHGHWYEGSLFGIDPNICLNHGVTTAVDAGTSGLVNYAWFRKRTIERVRTRVLAFLNISVLGISAPFIGELSDLHFARPRETAELLLFDPTLLGIKVRVGSVASGENSTAALEYAMEAATAAKRPLMVHISKGADTPYILRKLRAGDILTHCFQGRGDGLLCGGELIQEALGARAAGVVFDVGHGCGSFCWEVAKRSFEHHFYPDTISTDLHRYSIERWCIDMPTTMSKFLHLGMSLEDVILKTTLAPAKALGREHEIGTLRPGSSADIFVFSIEQGEFPLEDTHLKVAIADRMIRPYMTFRAGQAIRPKSCVGRLRSLYECDHDVFHRVEETA